MKATFEEKQRKKRCCSWETRLRRRRIVQSGFRLWHQVAECWVRNPTIASPSNSGSVTAVCSLVNVSRCPGETVCLTTSRSLNLAVKTLFCSLVALIPKIWWTLSSFTSQSFGLLTTSVWNHEVVPLSLYFNKKLTWLIYGVQTFLP